MPEHEPAVNILHETEELRCKEEIENTFQMAIPDESICLTDETVAETPKNVFKVIIEPVKKKEPAKSVKKVSKKKITKTVTSKK